MTRHLSPGHSLVVSLPADEQITSHPDTHSSQHHASRHIAYERQHEDHLGGFNFTTEDLEARQFNSV
jgi:hypothetical protein